MDFDNAVLLRSFPDVVTANMFASALAQEDIEAALVVDDAGGALPMMQVVRGVKLFVPADMEATARAVLEEFDNAPGIEELPGAALPDTGIEDADNPPDRDGPTAD